MDIKNYVFQEGEKPLDNIVYDGGFTSIFRRIACVGDSLASGEFEDKTGDATNYYDMFEYSWGQFIARKTGATVFNFSRGGMTAKEYVTSFAEENGMWDKDKWAQAYIIALGVNDILNQNLPLGSVADICKGDYTKNAPTFVGKYAEIIQRYSKISPNAFFFLLTMPPTEKEQSHVGKCNAHAQAIYSIKDFFDNVFVLDIKKYGPDFSDADFKERFFLHGHLNPMGYKLTADIIASYIDYIVRQNYTRFYKTGLISLNQNH